MEDAADTQTVTKGTSSGSFPSNIETSNDAFVTITETDQAVQTFADPDTQTLTKAIDCGGTFPTDLLTSNNVYVCRREQDQSATTFLDPDSDTVTKGTKAGTFPGDLTSDNGVYVSITEANQGITGTIAFDAAAESERIGTTDPHTWTHTPVGTPRAILVFTSHGVTATDHVLSCTYGAVSMTKSVTAADTATEPGRVDIWFLGSGIPTGAQTVSCDLDSATTDDIHFVSISFTGSGDTEATDTATDAENQANPTATLAYDGRREIAAMVFYSGAATPPATTSCSGSSACTLSHTMDQGAFGDSVAYQTTAGTTDQVMGWTQASDDVAVAYVAITETATAFDYELEYRIDWTGEVCADTRRLAVQSFRATANMENFDIQVGTFPGPTWNTRITVTRTTDDNVYDTWDLIVAEWNSGAPAIRFLDTDQANDPNQGQLSIDDAEVRCIPPADFELEYRTDWTGESCTGTRRLRVEAFMSANPGTENILVQVGTFPGPTWNTRITITATADPGTYQTYDLLDAEWNSGAPATRFLGNEEIGDTTQTDLSIDDLEVQCIPAADFEAEVRYDWVSMDPGGTTYTLKVECKRVANPENLLIQMGTFPGPTWNTRYTCDQNADTTYDTYPLTAAEVNSGAPAMRVLDSDQASEGSASSWDLDIIVIVIFTEEVVPPSPPPEEGGGNRRLIIVCALDWLSQAITCQDFSNYTGAMTVQTAWYIDNRFVAATPVNARVSLPTQDDPLNLQTHVYHEVTMELFLSNGGRQSKTIPVEGDYTWRIFIFAGIGLVVVIATVRAIRRVQRASP